MNPTNQNITTILIDRINKINQFRALPKAFNVEGRNYRIVTTDEYAQSDMYPLDFYDLKISPMDALPVWRDDLNYNPLSKTLYLERFTKDIQSHFLNTYVADSELAPMYMKLPYINLNLRRYMQIPSLYEFENCEVVIKPTGGARSIGIMFADTAKVNMRYFLEDFWKMLQDKVAITKKYVELCEKHKVKLVVGGERTPNELGEYFAEGFEFMLQTANPCAGLKTSHEFRLIKSLDKLAMICGRDHLNSDDVMVEKILSDNEFISTDGNYEQMETILNEVKAVLASPKFPLVYGSLDLWVDSESGQWGFYEFQSQYGFKFLPEYAHTMVMMKFIDSVYQQTKEIKFSL